jgi:hypothetical protein
MSDVIDFDARSDGQEFAAKNCEVCLKAKMPKHAFGKSESRADRPCELIHADLMGPITPESNGGSNYVLAVLDDFSRYSAVVCLASKDQAADELWSVLCRWERHTEQKIKTLRTDGGTEFLGNLAKELHAAGIRHQRTVLYNPQQNGRAERLNRTLVACAKSMLYDAAMPKEFWGEAIQTANFLRNLAYTESVKGVPEELFTGKKTDTGILNVFGCLAYSQIPKEKRSKFDATAEPALFTGYDLDTKGWRLMVYENDEWQYFLSRDVRFLEGKQGYK